MIRRRLVQRLTSAVVGATVAAFAGVAIATLSGTSLDVELVLIIGLAVLGGWLLLTAALTPVRRSAPADTYGAPAPADTYGAPTPATGTAAVESDDD